MAFAATYRDHYSLRAVHAKGWEEKAGHFAIKDEESGVAAGSPEAGMKCRAASESETHRIPSFTAAQRNVRSLFRNACSSARERTNGPQPSKSAEEWKTRFSHSYC